MIWKHCPDRTALPQPRVSAFSKNPPPANQSGPPIWDGTLDVRHRVLSLWHGVS